MSIKHGYGYQSYDYMPEYRIKGQTDWQKLSIVLDIPSEPNAEILFGVMFKGQGEVYFDEFKFEEVGYDIDVTGETKIRGNQGRPSNLSFESSVVKNQPN
ncbi:MAG: hypothetical protein HRT53_16540 [Colwellia sp.]|nr:hypothetical protein [Colwellia sp.]